MINNSISFVSNDRMLLYDNPIIIKHLKLFHIFILFCLKI